jgi:hypothetical protein
VGIVAPPRDRDAEQLFAIQLDGLAR